MKADKLVWFAVAISCLLSCPNMNAQTKLPKARIADKSSDIETHTSFPVTDAYGQLLATIPYPANWKINAHASPHQPFITGPGKLTVKNLPMQMFTCSWSPLLQLGRPLPSINQLIKNDLLPGWMKKGYTLMGYKEVPQVAKADLEYIQYLYQGLPWNKQAAAYAIDIRKSNEPTLRYSVILHIGAVTNTGFQQWFYYVQWLECEKQEFESARKQLLFSLANTRFTKNTRPIYNQPAIQSTGQYRQWYNEQESYRQHRNDMNEIIMDSWRERNASSDRMHRRTIEAIRGDTRQKRYRDTYY